MLRKDTAGRSCGLAGPRTRKESLPCWTIEIYGGSMKPWAASGTTISAAWQFTNQPPIVARPLLALPVRGCTLHAILCRPVPILTPSALPVLYLLRPPSASSFDRSLSDRCNAFPRTRLALVPASIPLRDIREYRVGARWATVL